MQLPRTPVSYNDIRNPRMVFIISAVVTIGKLQALHMSFLPKVSLSSLNTTHIAPVWPPGLDQHLFHEVTALKYSSSYF
jgi:hypothetical protein